MDCLTSKEKFEESLQLQMLALYQSMISVWSRLVSHSHVHMTAGQNVKKYLMCHIKILKYMQLQT